MANIKSAKKRISVINRKTARNRRVKGHVKSVLKDFDAAITAEDFAKAYYSADYPTAAVMCSSELEQMVRETGSVVDSLPEAAQEEFLELSRGVQTYAVEVHEWSRDSVTVDFDIIYPGEIEPMKTALTVVRNPETDVWKVVYAQERM